MNIEVIISLFSFLWVILLILKKPSRRIILTLPFILLVLITFLLLIQKPERTQGLGEILFISTFISFIYLYLLGHYEK